MYIIGDVHGCINTLRKLLDKLPNKLEPVVFTGDLIDRGPDSKAVIDLIIENNYACVLGNHESFLLASLSPKHAVIFPYSSPVSLWTYNGGIEAIKSLTGGSTDLTDIPRKYVEWAERLPLFLSYPEIKTASGRSLFVAHSGISSYYSLQTLDASMYDPSQGLLWYRGTPKDVPGIFQVFGHTPQKQPKITDYYACIDTGVFMKRPLTALHFPSMEVIQQDYIDRS